MSEEVPSYYDNESDEAEAERAQVPLLNDPNGPTRADLERELAEAKKDTERLDWLEGHQGRLVTIVRRMLDWNDVGNLRAAIDAARTKQS